MKKEHSFDAIAAQYDQEFTETATGQLQRQQVYHHLQDILQLPACKRIIEINCGTGADALWLVQQGKKVLATDISAEMIAQVERKRDESLPAAERQNLRTHCISASQLIKDLPTEKNFDLLLSNFGGLNCLSPEELEQFMGELENVLRPGGFAALVIMGRFCWWESLYYLAKGKLRSAFRRLRSEPTSAPLNESTFVNTWYYSPSWVSQRAEGLKQVHLHPIGIWLPPSYLDPFFRQRPSMLRWLTKLEKISAKWSPLAFAADHYLLLLQKK